MGRKKAYSPRSRDFWSRYYDPPEVPWPFAVRSLGYNCLHPDPVNVNLHHPYHHWMDAKKGRVLPTLTLVHILRGRGMFNSAPSGRFSVVQGDVFFVFPNVRHHYACVPEIGWDAAWLEMDAESALPLLSAAGVTPDAPKKSLPRAASLSDAFQSLFDLAKADVSPGVLSAAAHRVLAETLSVWRGESPCVRPVDLLRHELSGDVGGYVSVGAAVRRAGGSASHLRTAFKAETGFSPKQFQLRMRLARASELLRMTDLTVAEVAAQTGFHSAAVFSRRFSSAFGKSPRDFRLDKKVK